MSRCSECRPWTAGAYCRGRRAAAEENWLRRVRSDCRRTWQVAVRQAQTLRLVPFHKYLCHSIRAAAPGRDLPTPAGEYCHRCLILLPMTHTTLTSVGELTLRSQEVYFLGWHSG